MQAGLCFLEGSSSDGRVNLLPSAHRLRGPLDRAAFEAALRDLVARQPVLRSVLVAGEAGLQQRVLADCAFALAFVDLSALARAQAEAAALQGAEILQSEPIDMRVGPPFRAALYRLGAEEHVFIFVVHHLVWDGWSFDLLYTELAELYAARLEQRAPRLPALAVDYGDFAAWQQAQLAADAYRGSIEHFKHSLLPLPPALRLAPAAAASDRLSGRGNSLLVMLPMDELHRLHALARRHGTTLFVVLLAAWATELAAIGESDDLVLGLPVRGRERPELLPVMGCFVNAVPLRLRPRPLSLRAWLAEVHAALAEVLGHAELPLDALVPELRRAGAEPQRALFQTLFSFQDARDRITHWGPLEHARFDVPVRNSAHPLGLWCVEAPRGLELLFNYSTDVFDADRIEGWANRYAQRLREWGALPAEAAVAAGHTAPAAATETALTADSALALVRQLCCEVLKLPAVAPEDNFFDLGGHSLLALDFMARLEARSGRRLSLLRLGQASLRGLAEELAGGAAGPAQAVVAGAAQAPAAPAQGWLQRLFGR